jgi:predicted Zn-ribbon and HTH transcriptional regulator
MAHHKPEQEKKPPRYHVKKRLQKIKAMAVELIAVADRALADIQSVEEIRVMQWRCKFCGFEHNYTLPKTKDVNGPCPKCKSSDWLPLGQYVNPD